MTKRALQGATFVYVGMPTGRCQVIVWIALLAEVVSCQLAGCLPVVLQEKLEHGLVGM